MGGYRRLLKEIFILLAILVWYFLYLAAPSARPDEITEASWYSVESCRCEGTSGIMANGKRLKDEDFTCASWDYIFGTRLLVTELRGRKSIIVSVSDRGPAKRLYRMGRRLDLSKAAFSALAPLDRGVI